jgi:hypothetical protein
MKARFALFVACGFATCLAQIAPACADDLERIRVSSDMRSFVLNDSGRKFVPWGFNYDHDERGRLIEDYWIDEWEKVAQDFGEMRDLGANVVRIHLQLAKFMKSADEPDPAALEQLRKLLVLAEQTGLYLDLTGLGCYHKKDVPEWYDKLGEQERWNVQQRFWETVAGVCKTSPAVFCYDLMNEPVVPGGNEPARDWLGPPFAGKHFVQLIALARNDRPRPEIARAWIARLASAIRKVDSQHLITVGLVDWSLDRPGLTSGFVPEKIAGDLDFLCVHLYPKKGKLDEAMATLEGFSIGKPVVIEETFNLGTTAGELGEFIDRSTKFASGWIGFYWGKTLDECKDSDEIGDALTREWLELFVRKGPVMRDP